MPDRAETQRVGLRVAAAAVIAAPFVLGLAGGADADDGTHGQTVFRFADPDIVESSGLVADVVDGRPLVHTTNDSGDGGRVFTVDATTGETVGVTTWAAAPDDVEALAPAGPGHVWVGDIGDNSLDRTSVSVTRVPVGPGERTVEPRGVELTYPGTPRDAEALLVHPQTGRLYVATKGVFAGELYEVPALDAAATHEELRLLGQVAGIVTDGAFLPDGEHLVLRTYSRAVLYAFPSLEQVASWQLPAQEQGEGLAVESHGGVTTLLLSSEGQQAPVLRIPINLLTCD